MIPKLSEHSITPYQYCGTIGYFTDARFYMPALTRWLTSDPLWPDELPFVYASSCPTVKVDPLGTDDDDNCLGAYYKKGIPTNIPPWGLGPKPKGWVPPPWAKGRHSSSRSSKPEPPCNKGGKQCAILCDLLSKPWGAAGHSSNVAAQCVACCLETIPFSRNCLNDLTCCRNKCMALIPLPSSPGKGSLLLPCTC